MILKNTAVDYAWTPDTYCSNTRQSNLMIGGSDGDSAMTIKLNGHLFLSKRVKLVASCKMKLLDFALDNQKCYVKLSSYGYSTLDIVYHWKRKSLIIERKTIAQFYWRKSQLGEEIASYSTGNYSHLPSQCQLLRQAGVCLGCTCGRNQLDFVLDG
ncbi:gamma-aminobutyric acid receptor exp-1-like [Acropora millepora]|uniref:gamma-aminobutyric acid receptor exp-1-like n=1 Tax=Acropora millepora TaxID=45264 RepID=UPI001CF556B0|nr:gamma-aminobutyric acid receptor exp-1-like [Acropora millepora]